MGYRPARLDERLIPWPHSRLLLNRCWPRIGRVAASKVTDGSLSDVSDVSRGPTRQGSLLPVRWSVASYVFVWWSVCRQRRVRLPGAGRIPVLVFLGAVSVPLPLPNAIDPLGFPSIVQDVVNGDLVGRHCLWVVVTSRLRRWLPPSSLF